ncbi:hypothetical protein LCGC14_2617900, partial [marine sediment metagenome]
QFGNRFPLQLAQNQYFSLKIRFVDKRLRLRS